MVYCVGLLIRYTRMTGPTLQIVLKYTYIKKFCPCWK